MKVKVLQHHIDQAKAACARYGADGHWIHGAADGVMDAETDPCGMQHSHHCVISQALGELDGVRSVSTGVRSTIIYYQSDDGCWDTENYLVNDKGIAMIRDFDMGFDFEPGEIELSPKWIGPPL